MTLEGDKYIAEHGSDDLNEQEFVQSFQYIVDNDMPVSGKNKEVLDGLVAMGLVRKS